MIFEALQSELRRIYNEEQQVEQELMAVRSALSDLATTALIQEPMLNKQGVSTDIAPARITLSVGDVYFRVDAVREGMKLRKGVEENGKIDFDEVILLSKDKDEIALAIGAGLAQELKKR